MLPRALFSAALLAIFLGFFDFDAFGAPPATDLRRASAAVIFTGAHERVDAGLQLLHAGAVPRLYISGLNPNAGIIPARFVEQFSARNPNIPDLQRLVDCCVEWGERADNTLQNAVETKCWLDRRAPNGPLALITSRRHMARAIAALSGVVDRALIPYPVEDELTTAHGLRPRVLEYVKYLGATVALGAQRIVRGRTLEASIARFCAGGK